MDWWNRLVRRLEGGLIGRSHHTRLVQGTARTLIGRELELDQAEALAKRLGSDGTEMAAVVSEMLRSEEARRYAAPPLLLDAASINARTCFISLGTHCFTASLLQRWGLRSWSGPFDWLFASPSMLTHALDDDFATLLNRRYYQEVPVEERPNGPDVNRVEHLFYRDEHRVSYVFNHHDVHLDEGHAYLVRCVERLRAQLAADTHKTFLLLRRAEHAKTREIVELQQALARRTSNFRLCVFLVAKRQSIPLPRADVIRCDETLSIWRYHPCSTWHALYFDSPLDEVSLLRLASAPS
jgi:hypothetical protein